jgi:O-antigen/teichoic acid export membrane protein
MTSIAANPPTSTDAHAWTSSVPVAARRWLAAGGGLVALALLDQGVVSVTRFLTNVAIGRTCGKDELGLYALGFSILLLVVCAQESLITTPYTVLRNRRRGKGRSAMAASALVGHSFLLAMCFFLGLVAFVVLHAAGERQTAVVALCIAIGIIGTLMREFARRLAMAHLHMGVAVLIDSVFAILLMASLLIAVRLAALSAAVAYALVAAASAAVAVVWLIGSRERLHWMPRRFPTHWQASWKFGRWVFAGQIVLAASTAILPWLASAGGGSAAAGALAACLQIVLLTNPLVMAVGNVLTPSASQAAAEGPAHVRRLISRAAWWLALTMSAFCLAIFLSGDAILTLLYGDAFAGYGHPLAILALAALATAVALPADVGLQVLRRPDVNLRANVLGFAMTLVVAGAAVGSWGLLGISYGWLAGCMIASAWRMVGFARISAMAEGGAR